MPQVIPAMELLRGKLGMRPTDMRRVIRKAPEVLAPRPDGSTAAEVVEVGDSSTVFSILPADVHNWVLSFQLLVADCAFLSSLSSAHAP